MTSAIAAARAHRNRCEPGPTTAPLASDVSLLERRCPAGAVTWRFFESHPLRDS